MKYTTIRIEGAILSADILDKIEQGEIAGQLPKDFGLDPQTKVKDEIARTWADAQDLWRIFQRQKNKHGATQHGATETRKYWITPLLGLLGYDAELAKAQNVHGQSYAVSHQAANLDHFPIHIVGFNDSLDQKRTGGGPRMSPHALLQEYINLTEHLYALVTNGLQLRLLRDSSRLVKLSFIEFDLETMMADNHYADFALMHRLLHSSRMPRKTDLGADSLIERYHQDALDSGSRIRAGLSAAVEQSLRALADGFLKHPANDELRAEIDHQALAATTYYQYLLRLIYRLLFLMVIEERKLIFGPDVDKRQREIYAAYYSIDRIRKLSAQPFPADPGFSDLWIAVKNCFHLFENPAKGRHLGIRPLAGDLFGYHAIGVLNACELDNQVLLGCLRNLSVFYNNATGQKMRINYAALNVEEFGAVYENLLEYDPRFTAINGVSGFDLVKGRGRAASGAHYTPDELVQPLIKHSLDHVIQARLALSRDPAQRETALLDIKVCDVACGSGHILLNAARRIGTELAKARTGEDQPAPEPLRRAIRDVIRNCIYGVDKNPLATELCKVALWLEAHNPGEPLNFLDHHIKCGDAIVRLAHKEELENGVPNAAFQKMPGDDPDIRTELARRNKRDRKARAQRRFSFDAVVGKSLRDVSQMFADFDRLPENSPEEIEHKRRQYARMTSGANWMRLKTLADMQTAPFFIPKDAANADKIVTDETYMDYLSGVKAVHPVHAGKAGGVAAQKRFFHYFLEFPEVFAQGGFDCILGNPPYLGKSSIRSFYGANFQNYCNWRFHPASGCDLVTYFLRRDFELKKHVKAFIALITTNSIVDGSTREGGLDYIIKNKGVINFAVKSMKWPGTANVYISLIVITDETNKNLGHILNHNQVNTISSYLDTGLSEKPYSLKCNAGLMYQGCKLLGDGFIMSPEEFRALIEESGRNKEVLFPLLNAKDINNHPFQQSDRYAINFGELPVKQAMCYERIFEIVKKRVKPDRMNTSEKRSKENWWLYARSRPILHQHLKMTDECIVIPCTTKHLSFVFCKSNQVFTHALFVYVRKSEIDFAILQSSIHNEWARKYSGALKLDLRYSPSNCFVTFPFPQNLTEQQETQLTQLGRQYHDFRQTLMRDMQLGLTKTYNQFHNPHLKSLYLLKKLGGKLVALLGSISISIPRYQLKEEFYSVERFYL